MKLPKTHFFQGEEIPATLVFRNKSAHGFHTWMGTYDRSGRIENIKFFAQDEKGGWAPDPLGWYFQRSFGMGGGMGNFTDLGEWHAIFSVNDWLRFDHPGRYTLYAWSDRVQKGAFHDSRDSNGEVVSLVSDRVTITIDPLTQQDEQAVLDRARKVLAQPDAAFFSPMFPKDEVIEQLTKLSYLRTPAAMDELLPYLGQGNNDAGRRAAFGLLGAPDPRAQAPVLLEGVKRGKPLLNQFAVRIYEALKTFPSEAPLGMTIYGPDGKAITSPNDPGPLAQLEIVAAAKQSQYPAAVASACWADYEDHPQDPIASAALVRHQLDLTPDERFQLINRGVSSRDFLPILRKAAGAPDYNPYALGNLAGLAPDEARPLIIADIKRDESVYLNQAKTHFPTPVGLDALPVQPIPELTTTFRRKMKDPGIDPDMLMPLVDKYGTDDLLPDVIRYYKPQIGHLSCYAEGACLRFWTRHDPPAGLQAMQQALHTRVETRCYTVLFEYVLKDHWNPRAEPLVVEDLKDAEPDFALTALKLLEEHGTAKAAEPAIAALERIHTTAPPKIENEEPLYIQHEQQSSLAKDWLNGSNWTFTPAQKDRLRKIAGSAN